MTQLAFAIAGKAGPPSDAIGVPLRKVLGHWSAAGHVFDDRMRCTLCKRTWDQHQSEPADCPSLLDPKRKEKLAQKRKLVAEHSERSKRVRLMANRSGLLQAELAAKAGLPYENLVNMIRGKAHVTDASAEVLARVFCELRGYGFADAIADYLKGGQQDAIAKARGLSQSQLRAAIGRMKHTPRIAKVKLTPEQKRERKRDQDRKRIAAHRRKKREENL